MTELKEDNNSGYQHDDVYAFAASKGLVVVLPEQNQLQLDLDHPKEELPFLEKMLAICDKNGLIVEFASQTMSPGGNLHITLELFEKTVLGRAPKILSPIERIALQACLGSDRVRELLSVLRIYRGVPIPTCFFERPETMPVS